MRISTLFTFAAAAVCALGLSGCGGGGAKDGKKPAAKPEAQAHDYEHEHAAPHKGSLIELGNEEYHGELVHDEAANKVTIYVLDSGASKAVPITEKNVTINLTIDSKPEQFKLPAVPEASDGEGKSSRFELVDEKLAQALDAKDSKARLVLMISGKQYTGEIAAHEHK